MTGCVQARVSSFHCRNNDHTFLRLCNANKVVEAVSCSNIPRPVCYGKGTVALHCGCYGHVQSQWVLYPCSSQWVLHPCRSQWVLLSDQVNRCIPAQVNGRYGPVQCNITSDPALTNTGLGGAASLALHPKQRGGSSFLLKRPSRCFLCVGAATQTTKASVCAPIPRRMLAPSVSAPQPHHVRYNLLHKSLGAHSENISGCCVLFKSTGGPSLHKSMGAASLHKSMGAASLHKSIGAASLHKSMGAVSLQKSVGAASQHKSLDDVQILNKQHNVTLHRCSASVPLANCQHCKSRNQTR